MLLRLLLLLPFVTKLRGQVKSNVAKSAGLASHLSQKVNQLLVLMEFIG